MRDPATGRFRAGEQRLLAERFWEKVSPEPNTGCYLWIAAATELGYGVVRVAGRSVKAPRVAWMLTHGEIPDGYEVCHRCDTPACVYAGEPGDPERGHLFLGTHRDNMRDMAAKGRHRGTTGHVASPETRQLMSRVHKRKWKDPEFRKRACAAMLGKRIGTSPSDETRAKLSAARAGRKLTAEHRRKIGESLRRRSKGRKQS